jgi:hypothetical protein
MMFLIRASWRGVLTNNWWPDTKAKHDIERREMWLFPALRGMKTFLSVCTSRKPQSIALKKSWHGGFLRMIPQNSVLDPLRLRFTVPNVWSFHERLVIYASRRLCFFKANLRFKACSPRTRRVEPINKVTQVDPICKPALGPQTEVLQEWTCEKDLSIALWEYLSHQQFRAETSECESRMILSPWHFPLTINQSSSDRPSRSCSVDPIRPFVNLLSFPRDNCRRELSMTISLKERSWRFGHCGEVGFQGREVIFKLGLTLLLPIKKMIKISQSEDIRWGNLVSESQNLNCAILIAWDQKNRHGDKREISAGWRSTHSTWRTWHGITVEYEDYIGISI